MQTPWSISETTWPITTRPGRQLQRWGGGFYREAKWIPATKKEITDALKQGTIRYLICTDAASEGLNLQAASALINYDLPWNPSKVEQRIGRIDRIGQREREIRVYNLLLKNSIDEKVYGALRRRCGLFTHFVGTMQPVLARAQVMLNHPGEFSVDELERIASEAERNFLSAETYLDSEAVQVDQPIHAITRADIVSALEALQPEFGLQNCRPCRDGSRHCQGPRNQADPPCLHQPGPGRRNRRTAPDRT